MKPILTVSSLVLLASSTHASAHRLDEYLQATTISLEKTRVQAQIRLTPGVAVFPLVMATIDTDRNEVLSTPEQRSYAERVLGDLSLAVDGDRLKLQLVSANFPRTDVMREGRGEIQIDFVSDLRSDNDERKLVFENRHQRTISAYLVNCLEPRDPAIRVQTQERNYEQSLYQLDYVQGGTRAGQVSLAWAADARGWLAPAAIMLLARLVVLRRKRVRDSALNAQ